MFFEFGKLSPERREELKTKNWAQFCREAAKTKSSCKDCGWPLDDSPTDRVVFDRCLVCIALEAIIMASSYFNRLNREDDQARRRMGME